MSKVMTINVHDWVFEFVASLSCCLMCCCPNVMIGKKQTEEPSPKPVDVQVTHRMPSPPQLTIQVPPSPPSYLVATSPPRQSTPVKRLSLGGFEDKVVREMWT